MQRRDLIKRIRRESKAVGVDWGLARSGGGHDVYSLDGVKIPIPRHSEIGQHLAETIFKQCEAKLGEDWWR